MVAIAAGTGAHWNNRTLVVSRKVIERADVFLLERRLFTYHHCSVVRYAAVKFVASLLIHLLLGCILCVI